MRREKGRGEGRKRVTEGGEKRNQEEGSILHAPSEEQQQREHVLVFIDKLWLVSVYVGMHHYFPSLNLAILCISNKNIFPLDCVYFIKKYFTITFIILVFNQIDRSTLWSFLFKFIWFSNAEKPSLKICE